MTTKVGSHGVSLAKRIREIERELEASGLDPATRFAKERTLGQLRQLAAYEAAHRSAVVDGRRRRNGNADAR